MKRMTRAATLVLLMTSPALTHEKQPHSTTTTDNHKHSAKEQQEATRLGPHGGYIASASDHHKLELVEKDGKLALYALHRDGTEEDLSQASADLVILIDGKRHKLTLKNEQATSLSANSDLRLTPGTIVVVTLKIPDNEVAQARFQID